MTRALNPNENLVEVHGEDVVGPGVPLVQRVPQQVQVVQIEVSLASEENMDNEMLLVTSSISGYSCAGNSNFCSYFSNWKAFWRT